MISGFSIACIPASAWSKQRDRGCAKLWLCWDCLTLAAPGVAEVAVRRAMGILRPGKAIYMVTVHDRDSREAG